jgi:hypothetical protein
MYVKNKCDAEIECPALLTESGIILENGKTITEGRVVDLARKAKVLADSKKMSAFEDLILVGQEYKQLTHKEKLTLLNTDINPPHGTILRLLARCEYSRKY